MRGLTVCFTAIACFLCTCACASVSASSLPTCAEGTKVNWFHLQEDASTWKGLAQAIVREWDIVAEELREHLPGSKFGVALFGDAAKPYQVISDLSARLEAAKIHESLTKSRSKDIKQRRIRPQSKPVLRQDQEPLINVSVYSDSNQTSDSFTFLTVSQLSLDNSTREHRHTHSTTSHNEKHHLTSPKGQLQASPFTWPERQLQASPFTWPEKHVSNQRAVPNKSEATSTLGVDTETRLELAKDTNPVETTSWVELMALIGKKTGHSVSLSSAAFRSSENHDVSSSIIASMEAVMGCTMRKAQRHLAAVAEESTALECDNVCDCHSAECRPCCKKGEKVFIDIADAPSHLNLSMGGVLVN